MKLTATIRTRPGEGAKNVDGLTMDVLAATAPDYDTAYTDIVGRVPDGWQILSLRSS